AQCRGRLLEQVNALFAGGRRGAKAQEVADICQGVAEHHLIDGVWIGLPSIVAGGGRELERFGRQSRRILGRIGHTSAIVVDVRQVGSYGRGDIWGRVRLDRCESVAGQLRGLGEQRGLRVVIRQVRLIAQGARQRRAQGERAVWIGVGGEV